jgi:hypothetical protein
MRLQRPRWAGPNPPEPPEAESDEPRLLTAAAAGKSGANGAGGEQALTAVGPSSARDPIDALAVLSTDGLRDLIRDLLVGLDQRRQRLQEAIAQSEAAAQRAFAAHDGEAVQRAFAEQRQLAAQLTEIEEQRQQAQAALVANIQPDLDRWLAEVATTVASWRQEQAALVERVDALLAELERDIDTLGKLPGCRERRQRELLGRLTALVEWRSPDGPPVPPYSFDVPAVDVAAIAARMAEIYGKLQRW